MKKVPITTKALVQRINRKLKPDMRQLKAYRGGQWNNDLGRYYLVDYNRNALLEGSVDVEELARKLNCLQPWEELKE